MPCTKGVTQATIAARRALVAQYKARRFTHRQIAEVLERDHGIKVHYKTVQSDVYACAEVWRQQMAEGIEAHKMAQWVALDELERSGWMAGDMKIVAEAIAQKRKLMGTDAPVQSEQKLQVSAGKGVEYIEVPLPREAPPEPE